MRTSLYSILCIGIRLAAVLLAVHTLVGMPGAYAILHRDSNAGDLWLWAIFNIALLLLAFLLWVFPGMLARLAAGKASQQVFESPIEGGELQYIAFSVLGLWLFFDAIFGLSQIGLRELLLRHFLRSNTGLDTVELSAQSIASIVSNLINFVLSAALVFGGRGLVGLLRRVRHTGLVPASDGEHAVAEETEQS